MKDTELTRDVDLYGTITTAINRSMRVSRCNTLRAKLWRDACEGAHRTVVVAPEENYRQLCVSNARERLRSAHAYYLDAWSLESVRDTVRWFAKHGLR